jgi:hypothetical protein
MEFILTYWLLAQSTVGVFDQTANSLRSDRVRVHRSTFSSSDRVRVHRSTFSVLFRHGEDRVGARPRSMPTRRARLFRSGDVHHAGQH